MTITNRKMKDAALKVTKALPAGAASTTTDGLNTDVSARGEQPGNMELLLTYPALTLAELPDTKTMSYSIICSGNADLSSPTVIFPNVVVQTGATANATCPGGEFRIRLPSNGAQHWGVKATGVSTVDGSAKSMTAEFVF